jgi:hypothetical protein
MHDGDILTVIPPKPRILLVEDEPLLRGHLFRRRLPLKSASMWALNSLTRLCSSGPGLFRMGLAASMTISFASP